MALYLPHPGKNKSANFGKTLRKIRKSLKIRD
jgi:hypothetical protein